MSLLFDTTDWCLQTSREFGESIAFISGAEGVLFFANEATWNVNKGPADPRRRQ